MNEVEKMYRNAHVYPRVYGDITKETFENKVFNMADMCNEAFTAEKQLEIENIIFQCNFGICELQRTMSAEFTKDNRFVKHYFAWQYHAGDIGYYNEITGELFGDWDVEYSNPDRKEALAGFVNALWNEYLTEEECKQIRGILE